ncbi:MAG TPA: PAS domain-containing sensor histidine kinase [Aestuariivirga sp.]|nr:PAS domain-containing sensor histidine kinase [Aestuariivirga sp.]
MTVALSPTLEDLRDIPEPAWLWDGARARIAWANPAGITYFGGQSLFDLLDRPFDLREPGVEELAGLTRSLRRGEVENCLLHFPSSGAAPLTCKCTTHALADGRPGLLIVAAKTVEAEAGALQSDIAGAFDLLPTAAALVDKHGRLRHLNSAALLLLGSRHGDLAAVLGDRATSDDILTRLEQAGTISQVRSLSLPIGNRDIRLTARRLGSNSAEGAYGLLLLDDITERRALELKLTAPNSGSPVQAVAKPAMAPAEAKTPDKPGKALKKETSVSPPPPPGASARRNLNEIPDIVRKYIDRLPEAVLIAKDGVLLYANPAACKLLGHATAEDVINDQLLSERFGTLDKSLPATDVKMSTGASIQMMAHMSLLPWLNGPARQFVLEPAAVQASAPPPPKREPVVEPMAPSAEIIPSPVRAPLLEADEELRAILDTAADGIITLDAQFHIHTFSAGAEAIFGYRIAEVAGSPFADLIASESRKVLRDYFAALQGPGVASLFNDGREVMAVVKQGGTVPLFLTLGKLQAAKSEAAFCAVVRDITQWKKTETELRQAKEKAEAMSRQKSEFLARISHELRTPLNAIMGFSEVMRLQRFGRIENEKYRGYVNDIHASGGHLLSLINDLLDLSKVEAGKLELNFTSVNLADVTDHAMKMLQEQATSARVVLRKALPPELPNVVADLRSMRQIMLNLLSNALKFTDPGGQVIVSAQMTPAGELKLRVKDTGIGMDAEQLRDALEPFRRVSTEGRDAPGTGLGLPLTRALAEANRTQFTMSSEPRKGTLAEITFPTTRVLAE